MKPLSFVALSPTNHESECHVMPSQVSATSSSVAPRPLLYDAPPSPARWLSSQGRRGSAASDDLSLKEIVAADAPHVKLDPIFHANGLEDPVHMILCISVLAARVFGCEE